MRPSEPDPAGAPSGEARESRLSYSRLRAYGDCPFKYRLIYVDRRRAPLSAQSSLGHSLHRALEAFYREDGATLERLLELYDEGWFHPGYADAVQEVEFYEKGRKILRRYWVLEESRRSRIHFVEKEFAFRLGPHLIQGIIDRVDLHPDGSYEVIDYKTQQDPVGEEEVRGNLQLQIYGLALREAFGIEPARLSLLFLSEPRLVSVPYDRSREPELKRRLAETADRAAAGDFEPDTRHCPRCEFRRACPHSVARE
jgi:DNA helicase-2/ATP-dependent DNA helicase PcrA